MIPREESVRMSAVYFTAWSRYDLLQRAVASVLEGSLIPRQMIVFDDSNHMPRHIARWLEAQSDLCDIQMLMAPRERPEGIGVEAINCCLAEQDLVIANDDVTFCHNTLEQLVTAAQNDLESLVFLSGQKQIDRWALFYMRRRTLEEIGPFDETFVPPGYFSDNDMERRLVLAGKPPALVPGLFFHHVNSASLKAKNPADTQRHWNVTFAHNRDYYVAKWGGLPGQERYERPWQDAGPSGPTGPTSPCGRMGPQGALAREENHA